MSLAAVGAGLAISAHAIRGVNDRADDQAAQIETLSARAEQYAAGAEQLCDQVEALGGRCITDPSEWTGPAGPAGPAPTDRQVQNAVDAYMATHTIVEPKAILAAVADYIAAHPPKNGKDADPVTGEQILAAVATYLAANPPEKGDPGDPGRPPTAEEILAAVEAYFAENPGPYCPTGYEPREVDLVTVGGGIVHAVVCAQAD